MTPSVIAMRKNLARLMPVFLLLIPAGISGHVHAADMDEFNDYAGMIGDAPVGMTLSISGNKVAEGSHYYYRKYLKDITLTGTAGTDLRLSEPGGGLFVLHYVDNNSATVTADNSTGLAGTWSGNGHTLPVKLVAEGSGSYVPGHRYGDVTKKGDDQFEEPIKGFYDAAIAGRPADAARFVVFPLRVNTAPQRFLTVHNASEFQQKWNSIFSPAWLKALAAVSPHDLSVIQDKAMIGAGLAFFGENGLEVVNSIP